MDLLILNWKDIKNPDVGGAEIILYEIAKRLVRDGHRVTWFAREFDGGREREQIDGISVIRRGNRYSVYIEAFRYYRSLAVKPDKVLDCINTICWQTPLYVPREKRVAYINQLAKEVLYFELPPVVSHASYALEALEYQTYKSTPFLCYSQSVQKDVVSFGVPKANTTVFPIGIDHGRYVPGKKSKIPLFLFVGRLTAMKRPDLCVDAMSEVVKTYPQTRLAIVGYGPLEHTLIRKIKDLDLEKNVSLVYKDNLFFKKNSKDLKVKLMQEAWALLVPSVKEGWGLVVTEAGACETMSIATKVSGLVDSVIEGKTGLMLPANPNKSDVAHAMKYVLDHRDVVHTWGRNARDYALTFDWESSYQRFVEALHHSYAK